MLHFRHRMLQTAILAALVPASDAGAISPADEPGIVISGETQPDLTPDDSAPSISGSLALQPAYPKRPVPVVVTAKLVRATKAGGQLEIHLNMADDISIYSEHEHEFAAPLKFTLLDEKSRPMKSTIAYPKAKPVPLGGDFNDDFQVYAGRQTFVATFAADQAPKFVKVFYHGYHSAY